VADEALMDHIHIPDPIADRLIELQVQIDMLKMELDMLKSKK